MERQKSFEETGSQVRLDALELHHGAARHKSMPEMIFYAIATGRTMAHERNDRFTFALVFFLMTSAFTKNYNSSLPLPFSTEIPDDFAGMIGHPDRLLHLGN